MYGQSVSFITFGEKRKSTEVGMIPKEDKNGKRTGNPEDGLVSH